MFLVIGLSGKAGHGKDSAAGFMREVFEKHGVKCYQVSFAYKLKQVVMDLFDLDHYHIDTQEGKSERLERFGGITVREILQKFGTDVARNIYSNIWVYHYIKILKELQVDHSKYYKQPAAVFTSDVRFKNEYNVLKDNTLSNSIETRLIKVIRTNYDHGCGNHPSETDLDDIKMLDWDYYIEAEDLKTLKAKMFDVAMIEIMNHGLLGKW